MKTTIIYLVTFAVILFIVFQLDTASAQQSSDNSFRAPFISNLSSQQNMQSIMKNSEKDIVFIENLGQIRDTKGNRRPDILFLTRSQGVDMYITSSGLTYVFRRNEGDMNDREKASDMKSSYYRLDMEFVGMNKNINVTKEPAVKQKFNYFTPEYPDGISPKGYKKITIENLYEGIDLVYYEKEGKMKYDFIVKAGADPDKIKMKYKGAKNVYIDKDGSVIVTTPMGEIREEKPYTYSRKTGVEIESRFNVNGEVVLFDIAEYSKDEDIVIDPTRLWATYYGGNNGEIGYGICADNSGNIYVTGYTSSTNFPIVFFSGAFYQIYTGGSYDAFLVKFNSSGASIWSTYYGGNNGDVGRSICTDNSGNIYVTGHTLSTNFPTKTLTGAYNQATSGGSSDVFILKFSSSCARLWATYYGGSGIDDGMSICADNSSNIYVTGWTKSTNFPYQRLIGAYYQPHPAGNADGFILKFSSSCARLWATYYAGSGADYSNDICTDSFGNFYITGLTRSTDFPKQLLSGAFNQASFGGVEDAFILKFNSSSCARLWGTYYGAIDRDEGKGICTDNSGNLYVIGHTKSTNFSVQTLPGAYNQTTYGGGGYNGDAFILKFNSNNARLWATYYGGDSSEYGNAIHTDNSGNLIVSGATRSIDFPIQTLQGAYNQTTLGGGTHDIDIFILKFNSSSCARLWATYYGGNAGEQGYETCTDNLSNLYVTGFTASSNFPLQNLPGAYNQTTMGSGQDAYILKFSSIPVPSAPVLVSPPNGATSVATNSLLDWNSSATAESYRIIVTTASYTIYDSSNITITEFQVPNNGLNINTTYQWKVRASNVAGPGPYSTIFQFTTGATNITLNNEIPEEFRLYNNYPNPFNPSTKIKFDIPQSSQVKMIVYNILGKELSTLVNEKLSAGSYTVDWDGVDYSSGVYFYILITDEYIYVKKMLLIK